MSITKCLEFALLAVSLAGNVAGKTGEVGFKTTELAFCGLKNVSLGVQTVAEYAEKGTKSCGNGSRNLEQLSQEGIEKSKKLLLEERYWRGYALLTVCSLGDGLGKVGKVGFGAVELSSYGLKNASCLVKVVSEGAEVVSSGLKESSKDLEKNSQKLAENAEKISQGFVQGLNEGSENLLKLIKKYGNYFRLTH